MAGISKKRIKTKTGEKVKYTITYTDIFGKRHTSGYYDTIKEAKAHLKEFETPKKIENITYGFIFKEFLEKVRLKNASGTYENYRIIKDKYFKKYLSLPYEKVNSLNWQKFTLSCSCANKCYREYYPLLFTFIGTGAREGEILALEKTDFNHEQGYIEISKQFTRNKLKLSPKTESSNRKIYIFEDLKEVLAEHVKTLKPDNPLLFPNRAGNYINATNFRERFWKKLLELCKITKRVRLHDLRGSYTDMTLSSGLSIKFTQNQLGHSKADEVYLGHLNCN